MDPQDLLMQMMGQQEAQHQVPGAPVTGVNLDDPSQVDWGRLTQVLQLAPEEVQQLQMPQPPGGPGLAERLQAMRPQMDLGRLNLQLTEEGFEGRLAF